MTVLDWLVLAVYALLMLGVGLYYSHRNRTADDYVLGGRRMSPVAVGLSLFATLVSTLSYLANPGEM
ncbi:MAG: sodium:solute symporter, partial [Planctomycetaceae bacterium]